MSIDAAGDVLGGILDALTSVQEQLDALSESSERIEATHKEILTRLDIIDAGQAAVSDLTPILETILGRSIDDRELITKQLDTIATTVGFTHSAANGNRAPLPVTVASDPLLERFIRTQPEDLTSTERALVHWRNAAKVASDADLAVLLNAQYRPSPTDTAETRVMRYRLAAITRAEIERRGGVPLPAPTTTIATDRSAVSCMIRSNELAQLWRAGESAALYAEPELAGALDLFAQVERRLGPVPEGQSSPELVALHRDLATRIGAGDRPKMGEGSQANERVNTVEPGIDR